MKERFSVVIVGAGVTGLTIAALLSQGQHSDRMRLTLVDAMERPQYSANDDITLRVSAISNGSAALLERIGAWSTVRNTRACAFDRMRVWDESSIVESSETLRFDAAEFAVPQLGFIVENALLRHAILGVLAAADIEFAFAAPIQSLRQDGQQYRLQLDDARELKADLIIGADGAQSFIRHSVAIETHDWPYGQAAFVTHLRPEKSHRNTAWQRFLRNGPLGMLPLSDGRLSIVWTTTEEQADWAMSASDEDLGNSLSEASDQVLGALTVAGPRGKFALVARHAKHYVKPGIALIGDAAHAVHPLAGQGANLGLQDAMTLADVVETALGNGEHPGDRPVLRRYERARKGANAAMLHFMTGLNQLFATDLALIGELRTTGMCLFNWSGPIRKHVAGVALGTER